jgi:hypothetical protein
VRKSLPVVLDNAITAFLRTGGPMQLQTAGEVITM